jgi:hypothetical protein
MCLSGLPLFSSMFFFLRAPLHLLGLPLFSSEVFFDEPMNEGFDSAPLFIAPRVCAKALVECQANLASHFDPALT